MPCPSRGQRSTSVEPTFVEPRIAGSTLLRGAWAAGVVVDVAVTSGDALEAAVCAPRLFDAEIRMRIREPRRPP